VQKSLNKNEMEQPLIAAVETSGRLGSAALAVGEKLLAQRDFSAPMRHSSELFPAIEELLARFGRNPSQIGQVYLSIGPGSFTGLRIAVTFAKMLAMANSAKIAAVSTSDVIVSNAVTSINNCQKKQKYDRFGTILDAKRGQFFVAVYQKRAQTAADTKHRTPLGDYEKILPDCLMTAEKFLERFANCQPVTALLGEGLIYHADKFRARGIEIIDEQYWWPQASNVHQLGWYKATKGEFTDALELQPLYLRQPQLGVSRIRRNG
jgi:tRNA threonylcarbamoyladenosine biosynthesis protein TsaB